MLPRKMGSSLHDADVIYSHSLSTKIKKTNSHETKRDTILQADWVYTMLVEFENGRVTNS